MSTYNAFPYQSSIPYYCNGLLIKNDATTPDEIITVSTGSVLDSTGTFQIEVDTALSINNTTSGANGLDTGTVAASTVYVVHVIWDPTNTSTVAGLLSLSFSAPTLPTGYSVFKPIGFVTTDSSSDFLLGYWSGFNTNYRLFMYDAPQATAVTAGNATTYTAVDLSDFVPTVPLSDPQGFDIGVWINSVFTPGAAGRILNMQPTGATGDAVAITGQVTSVPVSTQSMVLHGNTSSLPRINYKVSNSGDAAAINVAGYYFYV